MNSYLWIRAMISSIVTFLASSGFITANPKGAGALPGNQVQVNAKKYIENYHVLVLKSVAFEESCDNKKKIERPKMEIKIRKGTFFIIEGKASFWQREIERKNNHSKGDSSGSAATKESSNDLTIEIDLDDLVKKIFVNDQMYYVSELEEQKHIREVIKELTVIFEFIINENNWKNEEIIKKPDYTTKILSYSVLRTIIEVFASSNPDKKSWCRLFSHLRNTLFNLSVDDFDVIVSTLIPRLAYLITFPKPVDNLQDINMTVFFNSFETFCELFGDNNILDYDIYLRIVDSFVFIYAMDCLKLPNDELVKVEDEDIKIAFLKLFVKSNPFFKTDLFKEQNITNEELRGYFYIISSFKPSEFYDLDLEEFTYLEEYFEYYLSTFLGFECVSASNSECGTISYMSIDKILKVLQDSGSFLVKHFVIDKKVWIHFGCNTMRIISEQPNKAFIYIFWRVLRNYVVLLGGDGILMTFEDGEKVNNPAEETPESAIFKLRSCGYWNLIDPEVEGKVVVHKGKSMKIVYNEEKCHNIILEIDGSNNLMPLYSKSSPEIVVFYRSREMKRNETCDLIRALPGCIFSEAIGIANGTGDDFDLAKIKKACKQMFRYDDILKVSILFYLAKYRRTFFKRPSYTNELFKQIRRYFLKHVGISRLTAALNRICSALLKLNKKNKNFRELSIEAVKDDYDEGFAELLKKLKLTSLHFVQFGLTYSESSHENHSRNTQILAAITENKFIKENLEHFSCFPPFDTNQIASNHISQLIRLKKISLSVHNENCFDFLITVLEKNANLVEIELHDYYFQLKTYEFLRCLNGKKILRLSILGRIRKCKEAIKLLFKQYFEILQSLKSMHVVTTSDYRKLCSNLSQHSYNTKHLRAWRTVLCEAGTEENYIKRLSKKRLLGFRLMSSVDPARKRNSLIKRYLSVN